MRRRELLKGLLALPLLALPLFKPDESTDAECLASLQEAWSTGEVPGWIWWPNPAADFSDSAVLPPLSERTWLVADGRALYAGSSFELIHPDGRHVDLYRNASLQEMERRYDRFGEAWYDHAMAKLKKGRV